jgi:lysophospholipase L1-like esterase
MYMGSLCLNNLIATLLFIILSSSSYADTISASDKGFLYTGRVDFSDKNKPYLTWSGSSIKANITGNKLVLLIEDQKGENFYNVIVNGNSNSPTVLKLSKGVKKYDLSYLITSPKTKFELFKRTEGYEGGTFFHGIEVQDGHVLAKRPERPLRKIAFFGDSITSAMGNEGADNDVDNRPSEKNHYLSYAAITARTLNAEFHTISRSGIGFMVSWFDFIMPQYYDQLTGVNNNDTQWDFKLWQPDVVVVNLGQNDSWLIDNEKRIQPEPTVQNIIDAYAAFITNLSKHYPNAQFVSVLGSMDATKSNKWPSYVKRAIKQVEQKNDKLKIDMTLFDFNGYKKHPRVQQHVANADKLSRHIKSLMNW